MSQANDVPGDRPLMPDELDSIVEAAREAEREGDYAAARETYERGLRVLARPEHAAIAAALLRWIGSAHREEGDGAAAVDCYAASLAVAEANDDTLNIAHALNCTGIVEWRWGNLDAAIDYFKRARDLADRIRAHRLVAMVDQNLGVISNIRGDHRSALHHYRSSLEGYRRLGDKGYLGQILNNLGMIHTDLEQWEEAERLFAEAAEVCVRISDTGTRIMIETNRSELYILQRQFDRARESCDVAFELASRSEHPHGLGEVHMNYGIIYRETGKPSLAEMHLRKACEIAERYSTPLLAAESQREIAQVYRALDRNQESLRALNYAHRVFNDLRASVDLADVDRRIAELEEIFLEVVRRWGESIESKDRYTAGHCERVADYSCMLAEAMGFDEQTLKWFRMGAFLHDVGKTMVPPEILNKKDALSEQEWAIMRQHTVIGEDLLSAIDFPWDVRPMIRSHHERWNGTGYPDGLEGRAIPLSARILCIADVFDALTTTRSYRERFPLKDALDIMERDSGEIFDPEMFETFRTLVEERLDEIEARRDALSTARPADEATSAADAASSTDAVHPTSGPAVG